MVCMDGGGGENGKEEEAEEKARYPHPNNWTGKKGTYLS